MGKVRLGSALSVAVFLAQAGFAAPAAPEPPASPPQTKAPEQAVIELLVASLADQKPIVRHLAARQLLAPELPADGVAAALGKAIRNADERTAPEQIRAYAELLTKMGAPAAGAADAIVAQLQPGSSLLRNPAGSHRSQGYLLAALARIGVPPKALPVVLQAVRSDVPGVYAGGASAAGALGTAARPAAPFLLRALEPGFQDTTLDPLFDPAPRGSRPGHGGATTVRREAMQALGKIGGAAAAPAIPLLLQIAQSPAKDANSVEQALVAIKALEDMGDVARPAFTQAWARFSQGAAVRVGQPVPDFSFVDLQGKTHTRKASQGRLALFVFVDTQCPCVAAYDGRLQTLHEKYKDQGLSIIYVYANPNDDAHAIEHAVAKGKYPWVTVRDEGQKLMRLMNARVASETCLLDRSGVLRYRGRIDDSVYDPKAVKEHNLEDAIRALLGGRAVAKPETTAFGCAFPRNGEG